MSEVRLQLWLAKAGVASRRRAESMIEAGEVEVNGKPVTKLGSKIDPVRDRVTVRGKAVAAEAAAYLLLNKPKGYVTTANDPDGRPTIFDLVPPQGVRLYPVGRLDYNTEGALLLTNDGELAHALMHPSRGVRKVYHAKFQGEVSREQVRQLENGVDLPPPANWYEEHPDERYRPERSAPADVSVVSSTGKHTWLELAIHEGKNRQIHRMAAAVGSAVRKLIRVAYGTLTIEGLEPGEHRALTDAEVAALRQLAGLSKRPAKVGPTQPRSTVGAARDRADEDEAPLGRRRDAAPRRARDEAPRGRSTAPRGARGEASRPGPDRDGARPRGARDEAARGRSAGTVRRDRDEAPRPLRRDRDESGPRRARDDASRPPRRDRDEARPAPRTREEPFRALRRDRTETRGPRDEAPRPPRRERDEPPRPSSRGRAEARPARRTREDAPSQPPRPPRRPAPRR